MQRLSDEIKSGQFHTLYLIYGEEDYLRRQFRDRLKDALVPAGDTMNYARFRGSEVQVEKVIDLAETMPFFADRRVIVIEDSGLFNKDGDRLADYVREKPDSTSIIFDEGEIDKRSRLYKAVADIGMADEMARQPVPVLEKWVISMLKKEGRSIAAPDLHYFLSLTGDNMDLISNEFEKLICYTMGRDSVTRADMDAVCIRQIDDQIFRMIEEMSAHHRDSALRMFMDLMALDEKPFRLLSLITRQYNILLEAKQLELGGAGRREVSEKLPHYYTQKYIDQARHMTLREIKTALEKCVGVDESVKTGRMSGEIAIEMLVVELSTGQ
jgi:DNA polymerase-3 subunit delta